MDKIENTSFENSETDHGIYENSALIANRNIALFTLGLAIIINIAVCVLISKDKTLKANQQRATFLAISLDEILVELMLLLMLMWTEGGSWCPIFLNVYMIGRLTTYSLLLYLCLERLLAVYPNQKIIFQKFRSRNGKIVYLTVSLLFVSMICIPTSLLTSAGREKPNYRGGCKSIRYNTVSIVTRFIPATYSMIILGIYCFLMKKIKNQHKKFSSNQSMKTSKKYLDKTIAATTIEMFPNVSNRNNIEQTTDLEGFSNETSNDQQDNQKSLTSSTECGFGMAKMSSSNKNNTMAPSNRRLWQKKANRVLRNAILSITIPSILLVGFQVVLMGLPDGDNRPVEIVVVTMLSAFSPAILYPSVVRVVKNDKTVAIPGT